MEPSSTLKVVASTSATGELSSSAEAKEIDISTFPQEPSWHVSQNLYQHQGFWYYPFVAKGVVLFQKNFTSQPNDIVLSTPPKCGTTWLKALAYAISTRKHSTNSLLTKMPHDVVPFIEILYPAGKNRDNQNLLIATHVPFKSLPNSILNSNTTKIIYLCRNPKDVLVSTWLFFASSKQLDDEKVIPFEEAYEKFCNGVSPYGPYWDHVLEYWKVSLEFPEKVLFLKYEDLKIDTGFYVKKMADFIGSPFSIDEENQGVVEKIIELCSFESLSNLQVNKSNSFSSHIPLKIEINAYFRKGEVGDWKNYLTVEMAERLDQITHHKFNGTGLYV